MKIVVLTIFTISTLVVQFDASLHDNNPSITNNGYNLTDLENDIRIINKSLLAYKEKEELQLELFRKEKEIDISSYFTDRMESYMDKTNNDTSTKNLCLTRFVRAWKGEIHHQLHELKVCADKAKNLSFHIPLEDIDYIVSTIVGNFSLNIETFKKDCEEWTTESLQKISMEECYASKSPLFQKLSNNFQNVIYHLKELVLENIQKTIPAIEKCANVTRGQLENHWSYIHEEMEECLN